MTAWPRVCARRVLDPSQLTLLTLFFSLQSCLQFLQHKGEDHLGSERGPASQVSCGLTGPVRGWAEALLSPVR